MTVVNLQRINMGAYLKKKKNNGENNINIGAVDARYTAA